MGNSAEIQRKITKKLTALKRFYGKKIDTINLQPYRKYLVACRFKLKIALKNGLSASKKYEATWHEIIHKQDALSERTCGISTQITKQTHSDEIDKLDEQLNIIRHKLNELKRKEELVLKDVDHLDE